MYTGSQITHKCRAGDDISASFYSCIGAFSIPRFHQVFVSWTWLSQRLVSETGTGFSEKWMSWLIKWWEFCFKIFVLKSLLYFRILFVRFLQTTCWDLNFLGERVQAHMRAAISTLSRTFSQACNHLRVSRISLDEFPYLLPHRVAFLRRFGMKTGIHLTHFGLESGMVFRELRECINVSIVWIPDE